MTYFLGRAESVVRILAETVSADRLIAEARADSEPQVDEAGLTGDALRNARRQNRRVEITLLPGAGRQ